MNNEKKEDDFFEYFQLQFKALSDINIENSARNKRKSKQKGLRKKNKCRKFLNDESFCVSSHEDEKQENQKISQIIKESADKESVFCQDFPGTSIYLNNLILLNPLHIMCFLDDNECRKSKSDNKTSQSNSIDKEKINEEISQETFPHHNLDPLAFSKINSKPNIDSRNEHNLNKMVFNKIKLNHVTKDFIKETKISKKLFYKIVYFACSQNIILT